MFKKIITFAFHLVFGLILGGIAAMFFPTASAAGGFIALVVMVIYWIISFKWTFRKKARSKKSRKVIKKPPVKNQTLNKTLSSRKKKPFAQKKEAVETAMKEQPSRLFDPGKSEEEEKLVEFRLDNSTATYNTKITKKQSGQPAKWILPGEAVKIGNYEIQAGNIYVGSHLRGLFTSQTEPSLLDPALPISSHSPDYYGEEMGYWPSYSHISPKSRAAYLEWLASDRSNPETYIGYVFLYFYGIERRLLINEDITSSERNTLVKELYRLKEFYGKNRSFNGYTTNLLSHIWVLHYADMQVKNSLLVANRNFTSVFKFVLARVVQSGLPVSAELAFSWVITHPELRLRTPARRCKNEFKHLFKIRYKQRFLDGMVISPNKTRLRLDYHPANASLSGHKGVQLDLPDVSRLVAPVKKLFKIAESCTDELDAYSRFIGRPENSRDSLVALSLLPNELLAAIKPEKFVRLQTWMESQITESKGLVAVTSMLELFEEDAPLKINKKEAEMIASLAEKAGFGIAPDSHFHHAKPDINGKLVLFEGGHGNDFSPSHAFNQVGTLLRLGAMVAGIDNHIDDTETAVLENLIDHDKQLNTREKRSLHAYLKWRLNTPANMSGLKARLDKISDHEKTAVSHILVGVALADGKVKSDEIKQLEKLYASLGLDKSMVVSDINYLSTGKSVKPDDQSQFKKNVSSSSTAATPSSSFSLDRDLLKVHEEETQDVQSILESIFVDENEIEEPPVDTFSVNEQADKIIGGLDKKHLILYQQLITKEEWSLDEVNDFCKELNLMTSGAIEVINDWAFDTVDAPLIEDGTTIFVDLELVEEIESL